VLMPLEVAPGGIQRDAADQQQQAGNTGRAPCLGRAFATTQQRIQQGRQRGQRQKTRDDNETVHEAGDSWSGSESSVASSLRRCPTTRHAITAPPSRNTAGASHSQVLRGRSRISS